ncbi:MAG: 50S ribosomal protein L29 [Candidatus Polarisedimenticolia bacterium]
MKAAKLRDMTNDELRTQETQLADQIFRLRFQVAASQAENPSRIRLLRKDLARVKTVLREKIGPAVNGRRSRAAATAGKAAGAAQEAASAASAAAPAPRRKAAPAKAGGAAKPAAASGRKRATASRPAKGARQSAKR